PRPRCFPTRRLTRGLPRPASGSGFSLFDSMPPPAALGIYVQFIRIGYSLPQTGGNGIAGTSGEYFGLAYAGSLAAATPFLTRRNLNVLRRTRMIQTVV